MGAVAKKIHEQAAPTQDDARVVEPSKLPSHRQLMELAAFTFAVPGSVAMALVTCVLAMWAMNGGGETAWALLATFGTIYGLVALPLIGASFAET